MDAWVFALGLGIALICIVLQIKYKGAVYGLVGGMVTFITLARLIADDALVIGHECCNAGADVPISLAQNDLSVVALILAALVCLQFAMVIEAGLNSEAKSK